LHFPSRLAGDSDGVAAIAIYHLRLKALSRGLGRAPKPGGATRRSAIAAAAYRSGERLYDQSQGKWFQFKNDVVFKEIMAPDNAPVWVFDRQTLWNAVERSEKRKDAQLLREAEVSVPRELSREQQIALVRSFVRDHFVKEGMIADVAIHEPLGSDGRLQPHGHVLLSMRRLNPSSPSGFNAMKEVSWNEDPDIALALSKARKLYNDTRLPEHKAALELVEAQRNVNVWRKGWQDYANRALADAGSAARIDHRTLEAQGIARPAQPNLGLARHIENLYQHLKDKLTNWVAVKKRSALYEEFRRYQRRNDPVKMAEFVLRLTDMAEDIASSFRRPPPIPEVPLER
jgi:ATP-dependent exoDNAse (exonuclease V) alpha subunit